MTKYNTNLAAEFWVLSMLHRLGADAALTLGNKKAVDILITTGEGQMKTVDVKGLEKKYDWPADNIRLPAPSNHFYVFLTFDGEIESPGHAPTVWIVPGDDVQRFIKHGTSRSWRSWVARSLLVHEGSQYLQAWSLLAPAGSAAEAQDVSRG